MAHSLRKYLSNRGSALFMVISTMTALMIACMAMYFSVVSSRQTTFATFFQQQSYQSAISLNDMVLAGLMDGSLTKGDSDLFKTLSAMKEGDTISTGANGFASFDSAQTGTDVEQMGAYSMDITRLPNEKVNGKDNMTFDLATTTINNGVAETVHMYVHVELTNEKLPEDNNIFAATGYVDNDASLGGGEFITDVFFDTETSYLSMPGGAGYCRISGNLRAGGNLVVNKSFSIMSPALDAKYSEFNQPTEWHILGDLTYCIDKQNITFNPDSTIVVGGDFIAEGGGIKVTSGNMDLYICGDLILKPGASIDFSNVNVHVAGDVDGNLGNSITGAASMEIGGSDKYIAAQKAAGWSSFSYSSTKPDMKEFAELMDSLKRNTQSRAYAKWVINDGDPDKDLDSSKDDYLPELDRNNLPQLGDDPSDRRFTQINIALNDSNRYDRDDDVPGMTTIYTIAYPGSRSDNGTADVVCRAGVINSVKGCFTGNMAPLTIILDTGEDPDNILTLRVKGYLDEDGNYGGNIFKWFHNCCTSNTILVKGKGSVVIDIPEGVTYQDCDRQQFMHEGWFSLLGGLSDQIWNADGSFTVEDENGVWSMQTAKYYSSAPITAIGNDSALKASQFIHKSCKKGDGCKYTMYTSSEKCSLEEHKDVFKIGVKCDPHGKTSVSEVCPLCHESEAMKIANLTGENINGNNPEHKKDYTKGVCDYRIDHEIVDDYYSNHPIERPTHDTYPNVNIYLVSCDESADIRIGYSLTGGPVMANGLYGFIYAPYMTFKAKGNSGGTSNKLCGGLIVSDFSFDDTYFVTNCYPDKMPWELMGESSGDELLALADRSWKIGLGSY